MVKEKAAKTQKWPIESSMLFFLTRKAPTIWHPTREAYRQLPDDARYNNVVITGACHNFDFNLTSSMTAERFQTQIETRFRDCGTAMVFSTGKINIPGLLHMPNAAMMAALVCQFHVAQKQYRFNIYNLKAVLAVVRTRMYFQPDYHAMVKFYPDCVTYQPERIKFAFVRKPPVHTKLIMTPYGTVNMYCRSPRLFWQQREAFLDMMLDFHHAQPHACPPGFAEIFTTGKVQPRGEARAKKVPITKPITKVFPAKRKKPIEPKGRKKRKTD